MFSKQYLGLPQFNSTGGNEYGVGGPTLKVLNETGGTTLPTATNSLWSEEESVDVEWAHAVAPMANIVVIEANSAGSVDLYQGVKEAASLPGVSVVSASWSQPELSYEAIYDSYFATPAGHQRVTFVASSGDSSSAVYPASSPDVLAVGATVVHFSPTNANVYIGETLASGSRGGASLYEPDRSTPDVVMHGRNESVFDTSAGGWTTASGSSVAAPQWAGIVALADQWRTERGWDTLTTAQTRAGLAALPAQDFHSVSGANVGRGSPRRAATGYRPGLLWMERAGQAPGVEHADDRSGRPAGDD